MYKAIVFIRTSTDNQEMESQRQSTIAFCKYDGYTDDEIKVIGTNGASAIKLDQQYLQDIDEIYKTIETNPIEGIYLFAIDRLGRNEPILVTLKEFCANNKIHLKIKDLDISLLNADKSLNETSNLMLSILSAQASSEMRIKKARFERARKRNYQEMKYMGGYIPYGYYIDDNGYYQVKEEEASIVRMVYTLFLTGEYSAEKLAREMNERGYRNGQGRLFNPQYIRLLLKSTVYVGEKTDRSGRSMIFPAIVSKQAQTKAREILLQNNKSINKGHTHFYFANKLITCPVCGYHYLRKSNVYTCCGRQISQKEGQSHLANCDNNLSVAVNCLDGILWDLTKKEMIKDLESDNTDKEKEAQANIEILNEKISTLNDKLSSFDSLLESKIMECDDLGLSSDLTRKRISNLLTKKKADEDALTYLIEERERYLHFLRRNEKYYISYQSITDVELRGREKEMSDLIHTYIHSVHLERSTYADNDKYILIEVKMKNNTHYKVWFNGRKKDGTKAYLWSSDDEVEASYDFANIERTDTGVTHSYVGYFQQLLNYCIEFHKHHSMEELWESIEVDDKVNKIFNLCMKYNHQQTIHLINYVAELE